jgi:isopenicillin-N epimerase
MANQLKPHFMLNPEIHFLNHGSFGACPRPVFQTLVEYQTLMERQPIEFLDRKIRERLAEARAGLAAYLNCQVDEIVYFPNPTTAINMVVRGLPLEAGDEILTTNHEYGAMDRTWRFMAERRGWRYLNYPVPLPVTDHAEFVEHFWQAVTDRTRVIFLSHITSQTALTFPVAEICRRARQAGILTIIDGAHAPGQVSVDLADIQPDIYTGACHKWLCAPKGSAFLYASPQAQTWMDPLVVSWGYQAETPSGSQFIDYHQWQGTRDLSAFLSVPAAIRFQAEHNWPQVRAECRALLSETRQRVNELTGLPPICPDTPEWFTQLAAVRLPELDTARLKARLYDEFKVEVPVYRWQGQPFLRISIQGYNTRTDADALVSALGVLLPQEAQG